MVEIRQRRNWGAKTNVALIFASIAAVLAVAALVTAVIDPPALGWVGFAIVAALVVGEEVEMGDANRNDEVDGHGAVEA